MCNRYSVYVHINNTNNKKYVGITCQKVEYRWNNGNGYKANPYFYSSIQKYGWDNFTHIVIRDGLSKEQAEKLEQTLIAMWSTQDKEYGYNVAAGGNGSTGYHPTQETLAKLSRIRTGKTHPTNTKRKMSDTRKQYLVDNPDVLQNMSESKYKAVEVRTPDGVLIGHFRSAVEAELKMGVSRQNISRYCSGTRKPKNNYIWNFAQ